MRFSQKEQTTTNTSLSLSQRLPQTILCAEERPVEASVIKGLGMVAKAIPVVMPRAYPEEEPARKAKDDIEKDQYNNLSSALCILSESTKAGKEEDLSDLPKESLEKITLLFEKTVNAALSGSKSTQANNSEPEVHQQKLRELHTLTSESKALSALLEKTESRHCEYILEHYLAHALDNKDFFKQTISEEIKEIEIANQKALAQLDEVDKILGSKNTTESARKMISQNYLISVNCENRYRGQIYELRDKLELTSTDSLSEGIRTFKEQERYLSELMSRLGKTQDFQETKLSYANLLKETFDTVCKDAISSSLQEYKEDISLDKFQIESQFNHKLQLIDELLKKELPENLYQNHLETLANATCVFGSQLEIIFAAETLLEEYLDKGSQTDSTVVKNILENTIDRINTREKTIAGNLSNNEFTEKYKAALLKGINLATQSKPLSNAQTVLLIFELLQVDTNINQLNSFFPQNTINYGDLGLSPRFTPLIEEKFNGLLSGNATTESMEALVELYSSARYSNISGISDELAWRRNNHNLTALSKGIFIILASLNENKAKETLTSREATHRSSMPSTAESKLEILSRIIDVDKGLIPASESSIERQRLEALKFTLKLIDSLESSSIAEDSRFGPNVARHIQTNEKHFYIDQRKSLVGIISSLDCFPDITKDNKSGLAQIQAFARLNRLSPETTGSLARIYLESCQMKDLSLTIDSPLSEEHSTINENLGRENLSRYLDGYETSKLVYGQIGLPRLLQRASQNPELKSSVLEFIVGFAGPHPALHRSQVELFHELTRGEYLDEYNYSDIAKILKGQTLGQ